MAKITYENKEAIQNDASLADKNKVTDADMNEIKQVVNANYDELTELAESLSEFEEAENLSGSVRIFNLSAGFYKVAKDATIYYKGASDDTALSSMGDLLLLVAVSKDGTYKHWIMFNGTGEELGYIRVGHTMSSSGTYVEYKSTAVADLIKIVEILVTDNATNKTNITALQQLVSALQTAVNNKVDKVNGKGLSTEDFTTALKQKLESLQNYDDTEIKGDITNIKEEQETQNTQIEALQQENAQLKSQIPCGQASGEAIVLEDSSDLEFKAFGLGGNHKQEVRSGKNICDMSRLTGETLSGVTVTYDEEEDVLIINGTCTKNNSTRSVYTAFEAIQNNTTISAFHMGGTVTTNEEFTASSPIAFRIYDGDYSAGLVMNLHELSNENPVASKTYPYATQELASYSLQFNKGAVFDNFKIKLMITDTVDTEYEKYGVAPSIEHPTEVEAVNTEINETVCNKNMWNFTDNHTQTKNGVTITINKEEQKIHLEGTVQAATTFLMGNFCDLDVFEKLINKQIRMSFYAKGIFDIEGEYKAQFIGRGEIYGNYYISNWIKGEGKTVATRTIIDQKITAFNVYLPPNLTINADIYIQLEEGTEATDYVKHQEQTLTMPVQQGMLTLEGDYFDWENEKEVHNWNKKIFDGTESWRMPATNEENAVFCNLSSTVIYDFASDVQEQLSTHFVWGGRKDGFQTALNTGVGMYTYNTGNYKYVYFVVPLSAASTAEEWKAWLAGQAEAGTPLTNYYIATTPTELEFTEQQKAVKEQIKNLHSYKNVTHIFSTDEVPAIADVTYYKDLETELAKRDSKDEDLQQQINNITELLSTTQTSAMLLDNYETDLESEVEEI